MKFIKSNLYDVILIYFGIFFCLYCFGSNFTLYGLEKIFILLIIFPILVIKIIESDKQNWLYGLLIFLIAFMIINFNNLLNGITYIFRATSFQGVYYTGNSYEINSSIFITILLIYIVLTIATTFCILRKRGVIFVILISGVLFIPTTYQEVENWPQIIIIMSYWILLFFTCNKRTRIYAQKMSYKIMIMILVLAYILSIAIPANINQTTPSLVELVNNIRNTFNQNNQTMDMINLELQGNRYYRNIQTISLSAFKPQSMFLKYYSAGIYDNNRWLIPSEIAYEENQINWSNIVSIRNNSYENSFEINDLTQSKNKLIPYGYNNVDDNNVINDSFIEVDSSQYTVRFNYPDFLVSHTSVYSDFVNDNYTFITPELEELFNDLDLNNTLQGVNSNETMNLIKSYLEEFCTYTLEPGFLPEGEDFITYFLQESNEGYCVHFASAAVMMARYMGYPARYVEGYYVSESDFNESNTATLYDYDQHAWVEIYDFERGWLPYEVTPASNYVNPTENQNNIDENPEDDLDTNNQVNNANNQQNQNQNQNNPTNDNDTQEESELDINIPFIVLAIVILLTILSFFLFPKFIWNKIKKKVHDNDYNLSIQYCKKYLSLCSLNELKHKEIFDKAAYSQYAMNEDEYLLIMNYFQTTMKEYYQSLKQFEKLRFRYKLTLMVLNSK